MKYIDGLGHEYDIPLQHVEQFEQRRQSLLVVAIVLKLFILAGLIALNWL